MVHSWINGNDFFMGLDDVMAGFLKRHCVADSCGWCFVWIDEFEWGLGSYSFDLVYKFANGYDTYSPFQSLTNHLISLLFCDVW